ncbi:hypothetical protein ACJJTC_007640 [Scirpophaga incertulas]
MSKTIKSNARSLLYIMINKYEQRKTETIRRVEEKIRLLVEIVLSANISVNTMRRITKEGSLSQGKWNTPGKKRPRQPRVSNLDDFDICAIRNKINEFYCVKKQVPTIKTLLAELRESIGSTGSRETLSQILLKNGFEFKSNKSERSLLIENFEISAWRHKYLRAIDQKRQEGKTIIYLDETYVHQNYRQKKSWQGLSTSGVIDKISKAADWKKCTDHVINVENEYKVTDRITEEQLEPFLIKVCDDESESDKSSEGIEFLESDFDYGSE